MKIIKTDGCVVSGIEINDTNIDVLTQEQQIEYYNQLLDYLKSKFSYENLHEVIDLVLELFGDWKYLYTCEQCGDSVHEIRLTI